MIRGISAALALFVTVATPASAQVTYAPEVFTRAGPVLLVVPARTVLVPRTRYVRRTVLVPRTRFVRRRVSVSVAVVGDRVVYPGTGFVGPLWVPPGTSYSCALGTVGCDSSVVGPMAF